MNKIYAVDFDGTLNTAEYPKLGEPNTELFQFLIKRQQSGDKIILWTCREGDLLQTADVQAAVNACKEENAYMFGDDEPINNPIGQTGGQTVTPPGKNPEEMSYEEYRAWREGK